MPYFFYQGKRCFYTCSGVGPPLLFLHGNTASSQMFQFLLPFYTPCFRCILPDFLGSGRSQRIPELPPQLWIDQGRQAAALIRHLGLGPAFLVGTSGGAWAALNVGLEHPDLVRDPSQTTWTWWEMFCLRNAGSGKTDRHRLYIMTKPAGSTVGIREGALTRKTGRRLKYSPRWPMANGGYRLVLLLTRSHIPHRTA